MTHWYRRPKRLDLGSFVRYPEYEFVFEDSEISVEELKALQSSIAPVIAAKRLRLGSGFSRTGRQILICRTNKAGISPSARLNEGWRGVVVVPDVIEHRRAVLTAFFLDQPRYRLSNRAIGMPQNHCLPAFTLDLTVRPPLFTAHEYSDQRNTCKKSLSK